MPEGLENDLKPAELADVFAFIGRTTAQPKALAGNQPRTVTQTAEGPIRLTASSAFVYGPSLTFEPEFGNLGYWHSPNDHAAWTFRVDRPARFTISMDWACADDSAGNAYEVRVDKTTIRRVIGSTGSWANYRSLFVGEATLGVGEHRLEMRPAGPIRSALADVPCHHPDSSQRGSVTSSASGFNHS